MSLYVQVMIRNPIPGNSLTADEAYETSHMNSKLYVGNLSFKTTEDGLRDAFGQFGNVTDVYVATDRETGRPRGFAFVTFSTAEESKLAIEKMHGVDLDGRAITVNEARPKEENGGGGRSFSSPNRRAGAFQARGNSRY
ncbi:MAG TPA: RNA-binding protein [Opitutaceae bacterium]|nr:RNA-binding protein [Opitutaceae bacterium]